jgi:hypothetical protein
MIKEVKMYTVICDNCGKDSNDGTEYSCWSEQSIAWDSAMDADWIEDNGMNYCPDCFTYGDEDELIIDKTRTKPNSL